MKKYVFDTNSIILILKGSPEAAPLLEKIKSGEITPLFSVITQIELLGFPQIDRKEENIIKKMLNQMTKINLNDEIAEKTIALKKEYKLKIPDAIIAATAITNNAILLTADLKHFRKIHLLKTVSPIDQRF